MPTKTIPTLFPFWRVRVFRGCITATYLSVANPAMVRMFAAAPRAEINQILDLK